MSYIYIQSEPGLWTVGHLAPGGTGPDRDFHPESDHKSPDEAAQRVNMLNGGPDADAIATLTRQNERLRQILDDVLSAAGDGYLRCTNKAAETIISDARALAEAEGR